MRGVRTSWWRCTGAVVAVWGLALPGIVGTPAHATASPASTRTVLAQASPKVDAGTAQATHAPWDLEPVGGGWGQIANNNNGQCMRAQGLAGAEVHLYSGCHPNPSVAPLNELWALDPTNDGWVYIRNMDSNMCLLAPSWNGYNLIQYPCGAYADQHWTYSYNSTRTQLRQRATGLCLVGPSWAPNDVVLTTCADFTDQYWNRVVEPDAEVDNEVFLEMDWVKVQFRRGRDCGVEWRYLMRDASWSYWNEGPAYSCTRYRIAAMRTVNRTIQFFIWGTDNAVWTSWFGQDMWISAPWVSLGGTTYSPPAAGTNADGRLQVFVRGADQRIHTNWQPLEGDFDYWSGWHAFHSLDYPNGGYAKSNPLVVHTGMGAEVMMDVYVDFPNGLTYARYQESPNCSTPNYPLYCWGDRWHRAGG